VTFYLDTSVIIPTLVEETTSAAIDRFMRICDQPLGIADSTAAEVASALSRFVRMASLSVDQANAYPANFDAWRAGETEDVEIRSADMRLTSILARRFDLRLRAPDALHIAICRRTGDTLVTLDRRLARAAKTLGVAVHVP
jgi:predicted nucleic acid-binding protein